MIGNSPASKHILTNGVDILRILLMADIGICVDFNLSSVVGIQVSDPYIRTGIMQDL